MPFAVVWESTAMARKRKQRAHREKRHSQNFQSEEWVQNARVAQKMFHLARLASPLLVILAGKIRAAFNSGKSKAEKRTSQCVLSVAKQTKKQVWFAVNFVSPSTQIARCQQNSTVIRLQKGCGVRKVFTSGKWEGDTAVKRNLFTMMTSGGIVSQDPANDRLVRGPRRLRHRVCL